MSHAPELSAKRAVVSALFGVLALASVASAAPVTIPPGLTAGDKYHLVFVTSAQGNATSSNIFDYDAFVMAQVALQPQLAALMTSWKVIGSTATVNAIDHIDVTAPVYRLDGLMVATGEADLFDGSLANPILLGMGGANDGGIRSVWTGTTLAGVGAVGNQLGATSVMRGLDDGIDSEWVAFGPTTATGIRSFYAISDELEVQAIPEPATWSLLAGPVLGLLWHRRRRRR